jgi:hypothetical protein
VEDVLDEDFLPGAHQNVVGIEDWEKDEQSAQNTKTGLDKLIRNPVLETRTWEASSTVGDQLLFNSSADNILTLSPTQSDILPSVDESMESLTLAQEEEHNQARKESKHYTPNYVFFATGTLDPEGVKPKPIKLKDAIGRKFAFPFHLCKTWVVGDNSDMKYFFPNMIPGNGGIIKKSFRKCGNPRTSCGCWSL